MNMFTALAELDELGGKVLRSHCWMKRRVIFDIAQRLSRFWRSDSTGGNDEIAVVKRSDRKFR